MSDLGGEILKPHPRKEVKSILTYLKMISFGGWLKISSFGRSTPFKSGCAEAESPVIFQSPLLYRVSSKRRDICLSSCFRISGFPDFCWKF
jgi:hypothetical protein